MSSGSDEYWKQKRIDARQREVKIVMDAYLSMINMFQLYSLLDDYMLKGDELFFRDMKPWPG